MIDSGNGNSLVGPYESVRVLDDSTYGLVKLGRHSAIGSEWVAMKEFKKSKLTQKVVQHMHLETEIHLKLSQNPRICKLYTVVETHESFYQIFEYLQGGDLFSYLFSRPILPEYHCLDLFLQICLAVQDIHNLNYSHHDLKLDNIMFSSPSSAPPTCISVLSSTLKIIDFGLSSYLPQSGLLSTFVGTEEYAAPEVFSRLPYDGKKIDIYALGVILYTLLHRQYPFKPREDIGLNEHVRQKSSDEYLNNTLGWRAGLAERVKMMVRRCLSVKSDERPTIEDMVKELKYLSQQRRVSKESEEEEMNKAAEMLCNIRNKQF